MIEAITLTPMRLTRQEYFRLLVKLWWRKLGWVYGLFFVIGIYAIARWPAELTVYGLLLIALPLVRLALLYRWTVHKDNARVYEERRFTVDAEKIIGTTPSGARAEVPWSHVVRVVEIDGRYLLYISAGQMLILDKVAFPDAAAEAQFRQWLAARPTA